MRNAGVYLKTALLLIAFALSSLMLTACGDNGVTVINGGKSDYVIVIGAACSETERQAANDLSTFLKRISGCQLDIVTDETSPADMEILVGSTNRATKTEVDYSSLGKEGYAYYAEGKRLFIRGGGDRGTLYGVYSFLEDQLKCYFFSSDVLSINETDTVTVPTKLYVTDKPAFEFRDPYWACATNTVYSAYNKINSNVSRSITPTYGGGITYKGFVHTFQSLVPVGDFFATHPEYFSEIGGVRVSDKQLCLSNPEVTEIIIDKVRQWLAENPEANIVSVSQNDTDGPCECDECKKIYKEEGSYSGAILRVVNAVADAVKDDYPDVAIDTLAYRYSRSAPQKTVPRDNVIIRLCTIECCFSHPLAECNYERADGFEESEKSVTDDLEAWAKICDRIYIWDYTTNFAHYVATFPNFDVLQPNLQYFKEHGVAGVFEQGDYQNSINCEFGDLRAYLLAKLLWNPYCDIEYYKELFMKAYYGDAAEYVNKYLDLTEKNSAENHFGIYDTPKVMVKYTEGEREEMTEWWDAAEAAVKDDAKALAHVKKSRLSFKMYMIGNGYIDNYESKKELLDIREAYYNECIDTGLTNFREGLSAIETPPSFSKAPVEW